jgi:transposase
MSAVSGFSTELEVARVRRTIDQLRGHLGESVRLLRELYEARAWVTLGLPSWAALIERELPELEQLLTEAERRAVVLELRAAGASLRAAAEPAKVSAATAKTWCDDAGVTPEKVTSLDGRVRPGSADNRPRMTTPRLTNVARAVLAIRGAGEQGMTVHELTRKLRLHHGATSALLSRLAGDGRLRYVAPAKRGQTGRYVHP